jgi:hypothetical protein
LFRILLTKSCRKLGPGSNRDVVGEYKRLVLGHLADEMSTLANTVEPAYSDDESRNAVQQHRATAATLL